MGCVPKCDTLFNISLSPCWSADLCAAATEPQCDSDPVHNLDYKFEFVMRNSSDAVSLSKLQVTTALYDGHALFIILCMECIVYNIPCTIYKTFKSVNKLSYIFMKGYS